MIYFAAAGVDGPVKIGYTESDPDRRLGELQTGSAQKLYLLAAEEGSRDMESAYHAVFAAHRLRGEWFKREPIVSHLEEKSGVTFPRTELGMEWPGAGDCCPECHELRWPYRLVESRRNDGIRGRYSCGCGNEWTCWYSWSMAKGLVNF